MNVFDFLGGLWGGVTGVASGVLDFIGVLIFGSSVMFFSFIDSLFYFLSSLLFLLDLFGYLIVLFILYMPTWFMLFELIVMIRVMMFNADAINQIIMLFQYNISFIYFIFEILKIVLQAVGTLSKITYEIAAKVVDLIVPT